MSKTRLKSITHTALLIAVTLVLRNFSFLIPFGGAGGMRIGIAGFFSKLPGFIFGPAYGGIADGLVDIIAYIIKPEGGYIPLLTATAVLGGIMAGFFWKWIKTIYVSLFRKIFALIFAIIGIIGAVNTIFVYFVPGSGYAMFLESFGKRTVYFTLWCTIAGFAALIIFAIDYLLRKSFKEVYAAEFIKMLTVLLIANITVTTLNTVILMSFTPALAKLGFAVFYIPRLIEEIIMTVIQSWGASFLLQLYSRYK